MNDDAITSAVHTGSTARLQSALEHAGVACSVTADGILSVPGEGRILCKLGTWMATGFGIADYPQTIGAEHVVDLCASLVRREAV